MALLTYTLLRIALVVAAGAVLYLLGVRSWLLVVLAVLMGAGLSYVLLDTQRRAAAGALERRMGGGPTRLERNVDRYAEEEDAELADLAGAEEAGAREPASGHGESRPGESQPGESRPGRPGGDRPADSRVADEGVDDIRGPHRDAVAGTANAPLDSEQPHSGESPGEERPTSSGTGG